MPFKYSHGREEAAIINGLVFLQIDKDEYLPTPE